MAEISLKNISKVYPGNVTAVQNFNLTIQDKEFVVLVGPSGCGKSTTLRIIAGLETITSGELYINEQLMNSTPPKDRNIAMVFQNYALYPHMTVYKNMAFALELRKTAKTEIDRRVREAARILDIEQLLHRKPGALSGGQSQRVALGRAIVRDPAVFLFDEPLSNLDAKLRAGMRTELIKLHQRLGTTFVYVTHDQTEAMTMGNRIVIMKDGLIQQVDAPQSLYDHPCNIFVAGFIGSPQMNFMHGRLETKNSNCYVLVKGDRIRAGAGRISDRLAGHIGKSVIVGVRPEDIRVDRAFVSENAESNVNVVVDHSESMGSEIYLYLDYNGDRLTARVPPGAVYKPGNRLTVAVNTAKLHLFDPETGGAFSRRF